MDKKKNNLEAVPWMSCRDVVNLLLDYVDGSLPEGLDLVLDRHFKLCPPCRELLLQYKAIPKIFSRAMSASDAERGDMPSEAASRLQDFLRKNIADSAPKSVSTPECPCCVRHARRHSAELELQSETKPDKTDSPSADGADD